MGTAGDGTDAGRVADLTQLADGAQFADAVLALLAVARRTRGRLQPLFEDVTVPQLVLLDHGVYVSMPEQLRRLYCQVRAAAVLPGTVGG